MQNFVTRVELYSGILIFRTPMVNENCFKKSGVKLQCSIRGGKRLLVPRENEGLRNRDSTVDIKILIIETKFCKRCNFPSFFFVCFRLLIIFFLCLKKN